MAKRRKLCIVSQSSGPSSSSRNQRPTQNTNETQIEAHFDTSTVVAQEQPPVSPSVQSEPVQEQPAGATVVQSEPENNEEQPSNRRTRGATVMADVWELEPDKKIRVELDNYGLPVGSGGCILTSFLGTVARNPLYAPINYEDWRKVPSKNKEDMWELVQKKFSFEPMATTETKSWILTDLNDKWRTWKNTLKSKVFDSSKTLEQMVENFNDARANEEQLKSLIRYWLTDEAKKISEINKVNKEKLKEPHAAGTKSFARIIHEDMLLNNGRRPSRAAIYIKTRYSTKLRDYVTLEAAEIAEAMKADLENIDPAEVSEANNTWIGDVYSKHKGPEKKGRVRCIGKRISASQDIGPSEQRNESAADSRIAELENKLTCLLAAFKQMCPNFSVDDAQATTSNGQTATSSDASGR